MPFSTPRAKILKGAAILLPGEITSGHIVPITCRGSFNTELIKESCFDDVDVTLKNRVAKGDILVTGRRFAKGEVGEESVMTLISLGFSGLISISINRLFFRNAINHGFPVVVLPVALEMIDDGDLLEVDPYESLVRNITRGLAAKGRMLSNTSKRILDAGGIVNDVLLQSEKKRLKSPPV
jgi:3-isopropylmalate/(R)-2-methylmalate dehydratase small subunit